MLKISIKFEVEKNITKADLKAIFNTLSDILKTQDLEENSIYRLANNNTTIEIN